jgi:alpha-ketoglutarate-dependent taurine dioxygenase
MSLSTQPLTAHIGVKVDGVDLSQPLSDATFAEILRLVHDHALVVFRGQRLTAHDQVQFSRRFGELEVHPLQEYSPQGYPEILLISNIFENGQPIGLYEGGDIEWHVDQAPTPQPPEFTFLYSRKAAKTGGDTLYAAAEAAYQALPEPVRERIDNLQAVHSMSHFLDARSKVGGEARPRRNEESRRTAPDVTHPLVRTHPVTGRRSLFVGSMTIKELVGVDREEGRALVDELLDHLTQDRFVYRHHWQEGDLVCWDNRSTVHTPTPCDRLRDQRVLHRTTVKGGTAVDSRAPALT